MLLHVGSVTALLPHGKITSGTILGHESGTKATLYSIYSPFLAPPVNNAGPFSALSDQTCSSQYYSNGLFKGSGAALC